MGVKMKRDIRFVRISMIFAFFLVFPFFSLSGVYLQNPVEVNLEAEDTIGIKLCSLKVGDQDIPLERANIFSPRKKIKFSFYPGNYFVSWSTIKEASKGSSGAPTENVRLIVIERGDSIIRIKISGNEISIY
jgi:hypothetical protein